MMLPERIEAGIEPMTPNPQKKLFSPQSYQEEAFAGLLTSLERLRNNIVQEGRRTFARWRPRIGRRDFLPSALNLAYYLALRRRDLRELQEALLSWGLSSLGHCAPRVLADLDALLATLSRLSQKPGRAYPGKGAFSLGSRLLAQHTEALFGLAPPHRQTRIMVTLSAETVQSPESVRELLRRGMNVARIDCARDSRDAWLSVINHVRQAAREAGQPCKICMDLSGPRPRIRRILPKRPKERLKQGTHLLLTPEEPKPSAEFPFQAECPVPEALGQVEVGALVWLDEGRLGLRVVEKIPRGLVAEVIHCKPKGGRLKPGKSLHFPTTHLHLAPLTPRDRKDLDVVVREADIIACPFVQHPEDIVQLQQEIKARRPDPESVALLARIETAAALRHLPELILAGAGKQPFGVLISHGDLAIEVGHQRLAEIQEEMLWLCEAAHTPVVRATQVLDHFVQKGRFSRAEMIDAAVAERSGCVLLNQGPYLEEALAVLNDVLGRIEGHRSRKTSRFRALMSWPEI